MNSNSITDHMNTHSVDFADEGSQPLVSRNSREVSKEKFSLDVSAIESTKHVHN